MQHSTTTIRRQPRRDRSQILARLERRRSLPSTFAPDFLHGAFELGSAVRAGFGDHAAFVIQSAEGIAVALFDDYFLSIHTNSDTRSNDVSEWVTRLVGASEVFLLELGSSERPLGIAPRVNFSLEFDALVRMEQLVLNVSRDGDALVPGISSLQTSAMSLIGLLVARQQTTTNLAA